MEALGLDIGGSGIKGAPVDVENGILLAERVRIETPFPSYPAEVAKVVGQITAHFNWKGSIGAGMPAVILNGVAMTAANIHPSWINTNTELLFSEATGCPFRVLNDADAAGLAELRFGAGQGRKGVIVVVTVGTGIGTAVFSNGCLIPNTELGHLEINGKDAETKASDAARKRDDLSWKKWANRFNQYLQTLERLLWPDLIILGGGVSKKFDKFSHSINVRAEILPAKFENDAGIVGAAIATTIR